MANYTQYPSNPPSGGNSGNNSDNDDTQVYGQPVGNQQNGSGNQYGQYGNQNQYGQYDNQYGSQYGQQGQYGYNQQGPYDQQNPYNNPYNQQGPYNGNGPFNQQYNQPYNPYGRFGQTKAKWSGWSIAGFIVSFFSSIIGLIFSILGLRQTKRTGRRGRGLAIAGIVISIVGFLLTIAVNVMGANYYDGYYNDAYNYGFFGNDYSYTDDSLTA